MRLLFLFMLSFMLLGCVDKTQEPVDIVAKVYDEVLTKQQLVTGLPKNMTKNDSLSLVKDHINTWVKQQLFYHKAKLNIEEKSLSNLVDNYKKELYISYYKNKLTNKSLDTVVSYLEIEEFYNKNKESFKLPEVLVKFRYIHLNKKNRNKRKIKKLLLSGTVADKQKILTDYEDHKDYYFNDSIWTSLQDVYNQKVNFPELNLKTLSKTKKMIEKYDYNGGLYYIVLEEILYKNNIAPLEYVRPTIKSILLHQNKKNFFKEMERVLIKDAVKQGEYEIY